jgi:hypothetical protein
MERSVYLFLLWPLEELGRSEWLNSSSFFCSLVSRAHLLAIAYTSSDVLRFFIASLWIKDESLSPFLKNMIIDLLSTSRMIFLLLQKRWINSQRDSPIFYTTLAISQSTPGCTHVA